MDPLISASSFLKTDDISQSKKQKRLSPDCQTPVSPNHPQWKQYKRSYLDNISKLMQGYIAEMEWSVLLGIISYVPQMVYMTRPDNVHHLEVPVVEPLKPEDAQALKQERKRLREQCCAIADRILQKISTMPYAELKKEYGQLKESQDQWLDCRLRLKPDRINSLTIYNFSGLREVVRTRLRVLKAQHKMNAMLASQPYCLKKEGDALFYMTKKDPAPMRFLVLPHQHKNLNKDQFYRKLQEAVAGGDCDKAVEPNTGIHYRELHHKDGPLPVLLCRFFTLEQLFEMISKGQIKAVDDHLDNLLALENDEDRRGFLGTSILNYRGAMVELLFGESSPLTQEDKNALFLNVLMSRQCPILAEALFPYISLEDPAVGVAAFNFALEIKNGKKIEQVLKAYPGLPLENPKPADLLWAIEKGLSQYALKLLDSGIPANTCIKEFTFTSYFTCLTSLGNLILWAEREPNPEAELVKLAAILIQRGADINQQMSSDTFSEYDCTVVERCYFSRKNKNCAEVLKILLSNGARISPRLAHSMLLEAEATGKKDFLPYLIAQGYLTQQLAETLTTKSGAVKEEKALLYKATLEALSYLQQAAPRFHLNQMDLDLNRISEIRLLKKKIKAYIKANPLETEHLQSTFSLLCQSYDKLVDGHLLLSELRTVSREFRTIAKTENKQAPSMRTVRFYGLWSPDHTYILNDASDRIKNLTAELRPAYWEAMRSRVIHAAEKVHKDPYLRKHFITWIHGTRSMSLPAMLKTGLLESLGELLKKNIVTFSGEVCGSDKSLNEAQISGERLTLSWGEGMWQYYDSLTRALTSHIYASYSRGYRPDERVFQPQLAWNRASVEHVQRLLNTRAEEYSHGFWTVVRLDILRLRSTDRDAAQKFQGLKSFIEESIRQGAHSPLLTSELKDLQQALTGPIPVFFDEADLKMINDPDSFGVILASTTRCSEPSKYYHGHADPYEFVVNGPVKLGSEIQASFAEPKRIPGLKSLFEHYKIRTYDYDTLFFLEMMQMIRGTRHRTLDAELKDKPDCERTQRKISLALQQDILPCYASPFPPHPKYVEEGASRHRQMIDKPYFGPSSSSHEDYMQKVSGGQELARTIHGTMHSVRACIWSQLVLRLYLKHSKIETQLPDPHLLALAAAAHDLSRQDEGKDYWDRSSAKWLRGYLLSRGYNQATIDPLFQALADKDPENRQFITLVQKCVHDADCLEIKRLPWHRKNFRKDELCFYRELKNAGIDLDKLIAEVEDFIVNTEEFSLKKALEENSLDFYGDVMKMLSRAHRKDGRYPLIHSLMKDELEFWGG